MPWTEVTVESEKRRFIALALMPNSNMSKLCEQFNISRKSGYKILSRYKNEGWESLNENSRRPKNNPNAISKEVIDVILTLRKDNPDWGGKKIHHYLKRKGYNNMPSTKTIQRILKRHGCITPEESAKHKAFIRFEHKNPNDLWQMDFKGHFKTMASRCHPLTLLDDHSRFSLAIRSCANEQRETVKAELIRIFRAYGLPNRMTMDNGSPWGYMDDQRQTKLTIWLIRLGIKVSHSRPYHPQTQGKLERFHRTLKLELLSRYQFSDLENAQSGFDWWRDKYNHDRPHEAINFAVPVERYRRSEREYPEQLVPIEYSRAYEVRKVDCSGFLSYKGKSYRVGRALSGHPVGLKPNEEEDMMDLFFCGQHIMTFSLANHGIN